MDEHFHDGTEPLGLQYTRNLIEHLLHGRATEEVDMEKSLTLEIQPRYSRDIAEI